ncbi:GDP dissociation inhibitor-domain-containing protein [Rhodocollybia butyracea]|uniref:GDP dissociation inhibitor-domain-containing protein n=1 Tax=Rhodocollybia butyracea TaxID=206335 RepID=A0A9P5Q6U5_9AGAR|nr:GDP dissociation inhibitor-domain-containing protein [Rhodocollybia butyracea]
MDEGAFDVIIIGTGLTESITAAALSKAGLKIAHLDTNPYYGANEASLSLDEFIHWANQQTNSSEFRFSSPLSPSDVLPNGRQYSISLSPSVIPASGPLISSLISSGVSRYGGFRLVEQVFVYHPAIPGKVKIVPGSKEDIFKDRSISLIDKRRLMRFLAFASGDFESQPELEGKAETPFVDFLKTTFTLKQEIAETIAYALGHCTLPSDHTAPALHRLQRYLRSAGQYGSSPFLIGHYGSSGEIAQGFCRSAAVAGSVYILGKSITSITRNANLESNPVYTVALSDFPESLTCNLIISSKSCLPGVLSDSEVLRAQKVPSTFIEDPATIARCVCITDEPLSLARWAEPLALEGDEPQSSPPVLDTGILVFPPSSLRGGSAYSSVTALIVGEGTMSVPKGKWILYLSTPIPTSSAESVSPESLLKPYLDATLSFAVSSVTPVPLFTSFYLQTPPSSPPSSEPYLDDRTPSILLSPSPSLLPLADSGDAAAVNAEAVFWNAIKALTGRVGSGKTFKESPVHGDEAEVDTKIEIESFWPPCVNDDNDDE